MSEFGYPDAKYAVTDFLVRCGVLGELYLLEQDSGLDNWSDLTGLAGYVESYNLGLALAYAIANKIVEPSLEAKKLVDEAWDDLMNKTIDGDDAFGGISSDAILTFVLEDWADKEES
jgi:hypothetical protein